MMSDLTRQEIVKQIPWFNDLFIANTPQEVIDWLEPNIRYHFAHLRFWVDLRTEAEARRQPTTEAGG